MSSFTVLFVIEIIVSLVVFILSACLKKSRDNAPPEEPVMVLPVVNRPPPAVRVIPVIYHPTSAAAPVPNHLPPPVAPPPPPPGAQNSTRSQTKEGKKHEVAIDVYNEEAADGERECSICLSEYENRELLGRLPVCNHIFHFDCIKIWLEINRTCPLCRWSNGDEP